MSTVSSFGAHVADAVLYPLIDSESERVRLRDVARNFAVRIVRAMQVHNRIAVCVAVYCCDAYALLRYGRPTHALPASTRLIFLEHCAATGVPGISQCARLFLTLSALAIFEDEAYMKHMHVDTTQLRILGKYYAGLSL